MHRKLDDRESLSSIIKRLLSLQSFQCAHERTRNPPNCYSLPLECRHFSVEVTDSGSPTSVVDLSNAVICEISRRNKIPPTVWAHAIDFRHMGFRLRYGEVKLSRREIGPRRRQRPTDFLFSATRIIVRVHSSTRQSPRSSRLLTEIGRTS